MARTFTDAPTETRCTAVVTLKDKTTADCGRARKVGTLCTQHAKVAKRNLHPSEAYAAGHGTVREVPRG